MEINWQIILRSANQFRVEMLRGLLEENNITSVVINKQDSSYLFGEVELYVRPEDVLEANRIIDSSEE